MERLLRRQDFLAAARGRSRATQGAVVQIRCREDEKPPRIGFTVTRKLGGAVTRNRIRRRLKEAVRTGATGCFRPGHDYVIIGRSATAGRPLTKLIDDIISAVDYLHGPGGQEVPAAGGRGRRRPKQDSL
ncbi:MAG: ribonuclease P protein component [Aestuariivirgaceae bacterium]